MSKPKQAARAARVTGRRTSFPAVVRGTALVAIFALGAGGLVSLATPTKTAAGPMDDEKVTERLDETRTALEKWHDARRTIAKAKRDWKLGKEILEQQIDLVERETETMLARVAETKKNITAASEKYAELEKKEADLAAAGKAFTDTIDVLEARMKTFLKRVPALARERDGIKALIRRIPEDPKTTKETPSNRFATIVGILGDLNKFNREIHTASEVQKLENGEEVEVTALYEGLSQGYYVTNDGKHAGMGAPTADGWAWEPANDAAAAIKEAIAVATGEQAAHFVPLPLKLQRMKMRKAAASTSSTSSDESSKTETDEKGEAK